MYIAVCDDLAQDLAILQDAVDQVLALQPHRILTYASAQELLDDQEHCEKLHIALLDISLAEKEMDGIALARHINQENPVCRIIFVTGHLNYATEVYSANHVYFILKTELKARLPEAIEKAKDTYVQGSSKLTVYQKEGKIFLSLGDIMYMERISRKTFIHCKQEKIVETSENLDGLIERSSSFAFIRCHRSYVVNAAYVDRCLRTEAYLSNGQRIAVGRKYYDNMKKSMLKFAGDVLV